MLYWLLSWPLPVLLPLGGNTWHMSMVMFSCIMWMAQDPTHDDVIKWQHFPRYWPFVRGIHRWPVNSPHKGQWRRALMFSLICVWINDWINNREAGDLRRYRGHYDVTLMWRQLDIASGNGLLPSGNKPLPEPMLTSIHDATGQSDMFDFSGVLLLSKLCLVHS